jgi:hypothetical protein
MKAAAPSNPVLSLLRWAWPLPVLVVLLLLATGCGASAGGAGANLTLKPVGQSQPFAKSFERAYVSRSTDGSYDIVLVDDDAVRLASATNETPGQPLAAAPAMPLRQVVHIRVLWRPLVGTESDNPSATNATINWYVFGGGSEQWTDLLHYGGVGFVTVSGSGDARRIDVRNATLKPLASQGGLSDPLGTTRLSGTLVARTDARRVRALLAETRETVATVGQAAKTAAHTVNP